MGILNLICQNQNKFISAFTQKEKPLADFNRLGREAAGKETIMSLPGWTLEKLSKIKMQEAWGEAQNARLVAEATRQSPRSTLFARLRTWLASQNSSREEPQQQVIVDTSMKDCVTC